MQTLGKNGAKIKGTEASCARRTMHDEFARISRSVAAKTGHPITFLMAVTLIATWAVSGPYFKFNNTWQLVINTFTTIATFLMVFLIQNTQNRDSAAVQLKLNEIIRALDTAENEVIGLEEKTQAELEEIKKEYHKIATSTQEIEEEISNKGSQSGSRS